MLWFWLALWALLIQSFYNLYSKRLLKEKVLEGAVFAVLTQLGVAALALPIILFKGLGFSGDWSIWPWMLLMDFAYVLAPYLYFTSLKKIEVSQSAIYQGLINFWLILGGFLFFQEKIDFVKIVAISLLFLSIIIVSYKEKRIHLSFFDILAIASTFFFALGAIADKYLVNHFSTLGYLFASFLIASLTMALVFSQKLVKNLGEIFAKKKLTLGIGLTSALSLATFYLVFKAYQLGGEVSRVNPILQAQPVLIVILGMLFLGERKDFFKKMVAAFLVVAGVWLIKG